MNPNSQFIFLVDFGMQQGEDIYENVYLETRILFFDGGYASGKTNGMTGSEIIREESAWKEAFEKKIKRLVECKEVK